MAPYWDNNLLYLHDLRDGTVRKTRLEIPALVLARLSDGRLLGVSGNDGPLTVFDSSGTVVARCRAPGMLPTVWQETDRICIVQIRGPDSHGLVSPETLDAMSVHVWRLDPA